MNNAPPQQLDCPNCKGTQIKSHGRRYALYPAGSVSILSLPVAWAHRASTPIDFECLACGHRFSKRTTAAKIAYIALWVAVGILIAWVAVALIPAG
jgi:hypothetical protein